MNSRIFFILSFVLSSFSGVFAQQTKDNAMDVSPIPGTKWDILGGIHIGAFDCNQTVKYPFSFGASFAVQYTPQIKYPAFLGLSLGGILIKGEEEPDHWGRNIDMSLFDLFMHVGYHLDLNDGKDMSTNYKLKVALGLPYVDFIQIKSKGPGFQKPSGGIGFGAMVMLDLPNRLSLMGTVYRIGKDLDGFGYSRSGDILEANSHSVSYLYKWGIFWRFTP